MFPRVFARAAAVLAACVGVLAVNVVPAAAVVGPGDVSVTPVAVAGQLRVHQQSTDSESSSDPSAESTALPRPRISPEESEQATQDKAQQKAIVAAVAIGLLAIVIVGRRKRNKGKISKRG